MSKLDPKADPKAIQLGEPDDINAPVRMEFQLEVMLSKKIKP